MSSLADEYHVSKRLWAFIEERIIAVYLLASIMETFIVITLVRQKKLLTNTFVPFLSWMNVPVSKN